MKGLLSQQAACAQAGCYYRSRGGKGSWCWKLSAHVLVLALSRERQGADRREEETHVRKEPDGLAALVAPVCH